MVLLGAIEWNPSKEIFSIDMSNTFLHSMFGMEHFAVRWYGLLFALGFLIGQQILIYMYKKEGKPERDVEILTIYMVLFTIVGARLGHCLFYDPKHYLSNPIEILKIWEGGLASHGATIGILLALYLYSNYFIKISLWPLEFVWRKQKRPGQSYFWILDRMVIVIAVAGCLIRIGNLMNSEIYGNKTDLPWGFIFTGAGETEAKHPTQIYEAAFCVFLFVLLFRIWQKRRSIIQDGYIFALFVVLLFTFRFLVEFLKEVQEPWEEKLPLKMGQWLSIPLIIAGTIILAKKWKPKPKEETEQVNKSVLASTK